MSRPVNVEGADVPIVKLLPLRKRQVSRKAYSKLMANIKTVGLIDPLCVCKDGETYHILDGHIRYDVLLELGVEIVPCLILESKDLYTPNRQVQNLSAKHEVDQLRKALKTIDEPTLAAAFGLTSLKSRLGTSFNKYLHPSVMAVMEEGRITRGIAKALSYVVPKRQVEILKLMEESGDRSVAFVRTQVLRTAAAMRVKKERGRTPWEHSAEKKRSLTTKLQEVEKHENFYNLVYKQYSVDLLKLAIYIRQILNRQPIQKFLQANHQETLSLFAEVVKESEGKSVAV